MAVTSMTTRHVVQRAPNVIDYVAGASFGSLVTAPVIYALMLPLAMLDLFVTVYQSICFPVYGVRRVRRASFFVFDREHLPYLNAIEKAHCGLCSYANGVLAYTREIASRTETYWCPIKHRRRLRDAHPRYASFCDYGDQHGYRSRVTSMRRSIARRRGRGRPIG